VRLAATRSERGETSPSFRDRSSSVDSRILETIASIHDHRSSDIIITLENVSVLETLVLHVLVVILLTVTFACVVLLLSQSQLATRLNKGL
jgi:hypothetical protein